MVAGAEKLIGELSAAVDPAPISRRARALRGSMCRSAGRPASATARSITPPRRGCWRWPRPAKPLCRGAKVPRRGRLSRRRRLPDLSKKVRDGAITPRVADEHRLQTAGLRGLGGAGFPTAARTGRSSALFPGPRLMSINADEGEPGTFKDREYLETDPHRVLRRRADRRACRRRAAHLLLHAR